MVHHSPSANTQAVLRAVIEGANFEGLEEVEVVVREALEATADDLLSADGYVLGTTANFGYISGALKHFFDTTFYAVEGATAKRPFSYWIHGGYDTTGAEQAMRSITTGYEWQLVTAPVVFTGEVTPEHREQCSEMSATVAASLLA